MDKNAMTMYRRKGRSLRAVQIASHDVNDLPDWARKAQQDEEIEVAAGGPVALSFVPLSEPWVIGWWIVEQDAVEPQALDYRLVSSDQFARFYEPVP